MAIVRRRSVPDFREALRLFGLYRLQHRFVKGRHSDLRGEAEHRLTQLQWIVTRLNEAEAASHRLFTRGPRQPENANSRTRWTRHLGEYTTEVIVLCDAFYYCAFRLTRVLQEFSGFARFNPMGVCSVRNHLLEHPKIMSPHWAFGYDVPGGPKIKPWGEHPNVKKDRGLFVNAQEFIDQLVPRLKKAVGE